ncbi:hypothetical protein VSDG_00818 [Cytospora chrysosperma]|uniref:Stc1 domain-containing protein n=1 Tax=Cytospora chrysosperma TaxID=252740 RepID=A0A423WL93_CYTCH|nr:hypothetical protein VSDG_00818 [Valsa sordida]
MSANKWSTNKKNQSLPHRLKCIADGKWELKEMFSNNMLQKYHSGQDITCRKHTQGPVSEIKCVTCYRYRPLNCFSNSARKMNGSHRCRDCVDWSEADLPGYNPLPAPNAQRSIEERELYQRPQQTIEVSDEYEKEDEYVTEIDGAASSTDQASSAGHSNQPLAGNPHGLTTYALQNFNASNPTYSRSGQSYHASSAPTDSASTFGTESTVRPRGHVEFNAYGPEGQAQKRVQSVTAASKMTATSASSSVPGRKNWAKPEGRKTGIAPPSYLEYENPDEAGNCYDSDGSEDFC